MQIEYCPFIRKMRVYTDESYTIIGEPKVVYISDHVLRESILEHDLTADEQEIKTGEVIVIQEDVREMVTRGTSRLFRTNIPPTFATIVQERQRAETITCVGREFTLTPLGCTSGIEGWIRETELDKIAQWYANTADEDSIGI